jgi:hypothetical protein
MNTVSPQLTQLICSEGSHLSPTVLKLLNIFDMRVYVHFSGQLKLEKYVQEKCIVTYHIIMYYNT